MKRIQTCRPAAALGAIGLMMVTACTVTGGVEGGVGYDAGYYEPYGYDYGGWGGDYRVGPGRGGDRRGGGPHPGARGGYRPAPASRGAPSIPHGSGGGGSRR